MLKPLLECQNIIMSYVPATRDDRHGGCLLLTKKILEPAHGYQSPIAA